MRRISFILLLCTAVTGCSKDTITTTNDTGSSSGTDTEISTEYTISVVFSASGDATVTGASSSQAISISGNGVTIVNSSSDAITYNLSGSTSNGYLKIYSGKKQEIVLNSVSITNPSGAAINIQGPSDSLSKGKTTHLVLNGSSSLSDGSSYTNTPSDEDEKGTIFSEGDIIIKGSGSLTVKATGKSGIVTDDDLLIESGTVTVNATASTFVSNGDTTKVAGLKGKESFTMTGGTLTVTSSGTGAKGISGDGTAEISGGNISITVTGSNFGSSSGGNGGGWGGGWGGNSSSNGVKAKGMKFDGNIIISGGTTSVSASNHEAIESKGTITISGGEVYAYSSDDAINAASTLTISDGYVCAYSSGNDGLDANGNCYIKGGLVYAIGTSSPEVAIDANTEGGYKLYVQGGTIIAIGGLESGSSLSQSCYSASSWSKSTWYALTVDSTTYAFKTPSSGGTPLVVSGSSTPTLKSGVSTSGGTSRFNGMMLVDASVSGGSSVSLSSYSGGNGGGPGGH